MTAPVPFEAFTVQMESWIGIPGEQLTESSRVFEDLGLDSLDLFRMAVYAEELSGVVYADAPFPELMTVGDIYKYYESLCAQAGSGAF